MLRVTRCVRQSSQFIVNLRQVTTMFYDGECPICIKEVSRYQELLKDDKLKFHDVTKDLGELINYGVTESDALKKLHVLRTSEDGTDKELITGVRSFIAVWRELRFSSYFILAKILETFPFVIPPLEIWYAHHVKTTLKKNRSKCDENCARDKRK